MNDGTIIHHDPLLEGDAEVAAGDVHDDDVDHDEDDDEEEHLQQVIVGRHGGSSGDLVTYYSNNFLTLCVKNVYIKFAAATLFLGNYLVEQACSVYSCHHLLLQKYIDMFLAFSNVREG